MSKFITVEHLVDMYNVTFESRVLGVTAAAEVDEVEELEVLLELVFRDVEPLYDLARRNDCVGLLAARREQIRKQRLQHREALGHDRARGPLSEEIGRAHV